MIQHDLHLRYNLAPGWLEPYVQGLQNGDAIASSCTNCSHTAFPPQLTCGCGASDRRWVKLDGYADIIHKTEGPDGSFALVRFKGADTATVVRLENLPVQDLHGQITKSANQLPQLVLGPLPAKAPL